MGPGRKVLLAVDDSKASDKTFQWTLDNFLREDDELHLIHVIPPAQRMLVAPEMGMPGGIMEEDEVLKKQQEEHALAFIHERFEVVLKQKRVQYDAHLIRCNTSSDSVGQLICARADLLKVAAVIMAKHNKGAVKEFFVGSSCSYVIHRCKQPVIVLHCD